MFFFTVEQSHSLNIKRVITIKPCESMYESQQKDIEMNILNEENKITSFCLHVVAKKDNLKWHHRKAVFTFPSAVEGTKWFKRIEDLLKGKGLSLIGVLICILADNCQFKI